MSVPMALLGLLDREPSHGYDLKRDYDTYFGRGRPLPKRWNRKNEQSCKSERKGLHHFLRMPGGKAVMLCLAALFLTRVISKNIR